MNGDLQKNYGEGVNKSMYAGTKFEDKEENVLFGTLGALLGALAGALIIVLLDKVGFVASISGVVMAFLSLFLYTKFAGKLSKKGVVICVVIMIVTVFLTEYLLYTYAVYKEWKVYGVSFGEVFKSLFDILKEFDLMGHFTRNILMLYAFTALGAIPKIRDISKLETQEIVKPVDMTMANGNTIQNSTETIDSDLANEETVKKFDDNFFNN